ncbi:hypothetical protein XENOCAPTIV_020966 [Xenoophorus captivus]|uniref:Vinculin-binding site-containing domain-containing protein n=1 Tax=Xenoophorus captivus TaxID=1517983 RepID=A0ABV0QDX1_9TELE
MVITISTKVFDFRATMTKSVTCPEELGGLASQVTVDYAQLAHQGRLAAATAEPEEVSSTLSCLKGYVGKSSIPQSFLRS